MKKFPILCLICVIFVLANVNINFTFAHGEVLEFWHNNKVFTYYLEPNIKQSSQFDLKYKLNKHNRFGSKQERQELLNHLLSIGIEKSVALEYIFPNLSTKIQQIERVVNKKPKNASLKTNSNAEKVFSISKEIYGIEINKNALFDKVCSAFLKNSKLKFKIPTKTLAPNTLSGDYEKFTHLRSDFSTDISRSIAERKHNIKNALNSLNKIEIAPNQVFSFNKTVGKRTIENGYRTAKIIVNNEFVEGVGGGVCQVSTTLYNSALLAGLEILEANKHSKQVSYIKYGFDAMVNFGSSDLKFRNNTTEKLTIITNYSPTHARIRIFGEEKKESYKLTNEIINIVDPIEEIKIDKNKEHLDKVEFEDEFFYLKTASKGMEIKSFREKYVDGTLVEKELLRNDKFKVQNAIKVYGAKKREQNVLTPIS